MEVGMANAAMPRPPRYQGIYSLNTSYEGDVCDWKAPIKIASDGIFLKDSSLQYALPVILLQLLLISLSSRLVYALLRPLKQPRILCDIVSGILLGPSFLTHNLELRARLFPYKSLALLRALASFGLTFKLFVMNVKMDPSIIVRPGKNALAVGLVSILVPFSLQFGLFQLLRSSHLIDPASSAGTGPDPTLVAVGLSITTYPVLADILDELGLLNTELGRLAMSSSAVNSTVGWIFLTVVISIKLSLGKLQNAVYSLATCTLLVLLAVFVFRPCMRWIVRRTPRGGRVGGGFILAILGAVVGSSIVSDSAGAMLILGPMILGLAVPDGPPLGAQLVEKLDMIVTEIFMPMIFASAGQITDFSSLKNHGGMQVGSSTMWFLFVVLIGFVAKMVAPLAVYNDISPQKALLLGLIMNFRGMIEMVILLSFTSFGFLDLGSYTVLISAIVLMTGTATALVKRYYDPLSVNYAVRRCSIEQLKPYSELHVLACMHDEEAVPAIISLLEASWVEGASPLCVYALHLVEQLGSATSSLIAHKKDKGPDDTRELDHLLNAFIHYEQSTKGHVVVHPFTAVAPYKTMHQDVCSLALQKNTALIVLPFIVNKDSADDAAGDADRAIRCVVPNVLSQAPCSVGILIIKSAGCPVLPSPGHYQQHIGVLFWGGPDDREALSYASRMLYQKGVHLTVIRFVLANDNKDKEAIEKLKSDNMNNEHLRLQEVVAKDVEQTITAIRSISSQQDLVIVGRRQNSSSFLGQGLAEWSEFPELGVVGDMLASSDFQSSSVLVVQQHGGSK